MACTNRQNFVFLRQKRLKMTSKPRHFSSNNRTVSPFNGVTNGVYLQKDMDYLNQKKYICLGFCECRCISLHFG